MSTEQILRNAFAKTAIMLLLRGKKTILPVSDTLINYLNRFADTLRESVQHALWESQAAGHIREPKIGQSQ